MDKFQIYVLIKDFYKEGSVVMAFDVHDKKELMRGKSLLCRCMMIAESPLQVVKLGGIGALEVYSEYAPYYFAKDEQELLDICITGKMPDVHEDGTITNFPVRV